MRRLLLLMLTLAAAGAAPASAQIRRVAGAGWTGATLDRIERALRYREALELSDEQVERLDALRAEHVATVARTSAERLDIISRVRSGLLDEDEAAEALEDMDDRAWHDDEQLQDGVDAILTDEQEADVDARRGPWRVPDGPWRTPQPPAWRGYAAPPGWPPSPAPAPLPPRPWLRAPDAPPAPPAPPRRYWLR